MSAPLAIDVPSRPAASPELQGLAIDWVPQFRRSSVASYRLRCARLLPLFRAQGCRVRIVKVGQAAQSLARVVIFQKAYGAAERSAAQALARRGVKTILDLCDQHLWAHPDYPETHERREALLRMLETVDVVTCATPTLAAAIPHPRLQVVDDLLEEGALTLGGGWLSHWLTAPLPPREQARRRSTRLIWFGHAGADFPPFGISDLAHALPQLARVHNETPLSLTVVSNSRARFEKYVATAPFPTKYITWRSWIMRPLLRQHDVCLLPITDNPFTRCKTANRPALSIGCGLPVVAEPIPSYRELADFLYLGDIESGVREAIAEPVAARERTERGAAYLQQRFASERIVGQWQMAVSAALTSPQIGDRSHSNRSS